MIEPSINFTASFNDPSLTEQVRSVFTFEKRDLPFLIDVNIDIKRIISENRSKIGLTVKINMIHNDFRVDVISESFSMACLQAREIINIKLSKELRFKEFINFASMSTHQPEL
ncbi:hypothetical protein [Anditalea andensis]|uniref:Uncharacterized protein n=1 Tax=Anditalea andensis TaxID=1048983 RepID=A0A074L3W1_9BACT|nr:hypothetical protein [Anditalea andensis]KEO74538.1 hypothetical protein EL17_02365 [Anditalea andensis]